MIAKRSKIMYNPRYTLKKRGDGMGKKRRWAALFCLTALLLGLAGCAGTGKAASQQPSRQEAAEEEPGRRIVIATMSEPPSLSPTGHSSVAGDYMNLLTYSTLFRLDMEMTPQPHLVEEYQAVSSTLWRFCLRDGVHFHDGTPLTALDVKASLERARTFPQVSRYTDCIQKVRVVDRLCFEIETRRPSACLINDLCIHANSILPKHLIDSGNDFSKNPIGSGPYRFCTWVLGDRLEFEAFSDYFLGEPPITHMVWRIIPRGEERTAALENGEVDFLMDVENTHCQRLKQCSGIQVTEFLSTGPTWLMLNNQHPALSNLWVRRAVSAAIDRERVIQEALGGLGEAAVGQAPFNLPGYTEENAQGYDPQLAREYLGRSGVDAQEIQLSIICSSDTKRRAAQVIVRDLAAIGIAAQVESMDLATYLAATTQGHYSAAIGGYAASTMLGYMTAVFHSGSIGSTNKTFLRSGELDRLIDQAQVTTDRQQRIGILRQACALANSLCTQAPLYQPVELRAYREGLQGVEIAPSGKLYFESLSWAGQTGTPRPPSA